MKRTIQALVVAALLNATCALADDPANVLLAKVTRADMYSGELGIGNTVSAFPSSVDDAGISVSSTGTYADRHAAAKGAMVSAFPSSVDDAGISVASKSTYADQFVTERSLQARGASDPALSQ
jgi:hypothetical protein